MKHYYSLIAFLLLACSCHWNRPGSGQIEADSINRTKKVKAPSWEQLIKSAEKDHEIYHAYEVSKDTLILLRRSVGFELSSDEGKTWKWMGKRIPRFDEFTIDDKGLWWGLARWKGIHEASYCRLYKSTDSGITWQGYVFDPSVFFPYHIYSSIHQPLAVSTFTDKKVYWLRGTDPQHHWIYIKQLAVVDGFADISTENYSVSSENDDNKLYVKRKNGKTDTLLHFNKAYNIYYIEKDNNLIYVAGPAENGVDSYFAKIKNEHIQNEYIIPGGDLEMKKTKLNHILLCGMDGAYIFKNDKLLHLFK